MTLTQTLIKTLDDNAPTKTEVIDSSHLVEHARKNKILLQLLRHLDLQGPLRERQEKTLKTIQEALLEITGHVQGLDYAVIKFFKPVVYLPSDIDLLVYREHLPILSRTLRQLGYKRIVVETNCVTFRGQTLVDVYSNPDFANIPYIKGEKVLEFTEAWDINGVKVKRLRPEAEAVLALSHAIYKEQLLTLNDYYTAKSYLNTEAQRIAEELGVADALPYSRRVFKEMEGGLIEAPARIPLRHSARLFSSKITGDPLSRNFLPHLFLKLLDPRILTLIKSSLIRQTY